MSIMKHSSYENSSIRPDIRELLALRHYARKIQLFNDSKVHSVQAGNRLSIARGRGMDFEEVRHYQPGDDIRLIHWPLTARLGKPFTKVYREERERAIYLVIDQSTSMHFGTKVCFKNVTAAKLAALLGFAALNHHEQVGGIIFNDQHAEYIQPRRSRLALLNLFSLLNNNALLKRCNGGLNNNLQLLSQTLQTGSVVILLSDFCGLDHTTEQYLRLINRKAEIINIMIYDQLEATLPTINEHYTFTEDGTSKLEISASKKNQALYALAFKQRLETLQTLVRTNKMQLVTLTANDNLVERINQGILKYGY